MEESTTAQPEQTTNDATNEATEQSVEEVSDQQDDNQPQENTSQESSTPVEQSDTSDDSNDEILNYQSPQFQPQTIDFSQLPVDAEGNVDPNAFAQALAYMQQQTLEQARAQARDEMMQLRQEERLWQKAEKQYPELASNNKLRGLVQNTRYGIIASGKNASPLDAAKQIFEHIGVARQQGQTAAKESVEIQRSAGLQSSSTRSPSNSATSDLMGKISSRNKQEAESARQALLEQWISDGTIKTR